MAALKKHHQPPSRTARARALRGEQNNAEALLWNALRNRQLNGIKFRRQYPIGLYTADFASLEHRLVVEADGISHFARLLKDVERDEFMERMDWRVMRFSNQQVERDLAYVLDRIREAVESPGSALD